MEDAAAVCGMELGSLGGEPLSLSSQSLKRPGEHGLSTSTGADTDSHSGSDGTNDRDLGESKQAASARPFEEGLGMDLDEDQRMFSPHADSSAGFEKLAASEGSRLHTRRDSSANLLNFLEEGDPSSSTAFGGVNWMAGASFGTAQNLSFRVWLANIKACIVVDSHGELGSARWS